MKFDTDYIEKLSKIIADNGLTEISLEDGEQAITIRKDLPEVIAATPVAAAAPQAVTSAPAQTVSAPAATVEAPKGKAITSPMVGTFYSAPSPDAEPFVEVGKTISEGDVLSENDEQEQDNTDENTESSNNKITEPDEELSEENFDDFVDLFDHLNQFQFVLFVE